MKSTTITGIVLSFPSFDYFFRKSKVTVLTFVMNAILL